jgi:rare lipoprotein A (peptidoglycan hydrolase)
VRTDAGAQATTMSAAAKAKAKRKAARKRLFKRRKNPGPWRVSQRVTWYGPGFYGNRTACGQRYTRTIRGVAHRSLPCGTMVQFRWRGKVATAPVIDRGPYGHRDLKFDWSARVACKVFRPRKGTRGCFTRHDVRYRVVGKVNLDRWFKVNAG